MRVATVDIGTNTVLLLVADTGADVGGAGPVAVCERATITRLGEGVDETRRLTPAAIARTNAALTEYAEVASKLGATRVAVVGTSAMRDAGGGDEVRAHVARVFGVEARTIGGDEEARLTLTGALSGFPADALRDVARDGEVTVFDVGGGSTEIVRGRADAVSFGVSLNIGSVRMTERNVRSDPPSAAEIDAVRAEVAKAIGTTTGLPTAKTAIGIAGTVTTIAAVSLGLDPYEGSKVHGLSIPRAEVARVAGMLASLPLETRRKVPGLNPKRADVIVAGAYVVLGVLEALGAETLVVSDRGVRWGLAVALSASSATV